MHHPFNFYIFHFIGNDKVAEFLIRNGADPNAKQDDGIEILGKAIAEGLLNNNHDYWMHLTMSDALCARDFCESVISCK